MNKNCIQGRRVVVSWHNTAKPRDSRAQVNAAVVWGSFTFLPGEASELRAGGFRSTRKAGAALVERWAPWIPEESAEGIVVAAPRDVSNRRRVTRPVKKAQDSNAMKARTEGVEPTGGQR